MDMKGKVIDSIQVSEKELHGVSYHNMDYYIVSSAGSNWEGTNTVMIVNPTTKEILLTFLPDTTFNNPWTVCGISLDLCVNDHRNNCIKQLDLSGKSLRVYGERERADQGGLTRPWGMCTDPAGRLLVCDRDNSRIVSYWLEQDDVNYEVLLDMKKLDGKVSPHFVLCDSANRMLFVGFHDGHILVFSG